MRRAIVCAALVFVCIPASYAQRLTGGVRSVPVARGDTLRTLGSRSGVDPRTIALDNDLPADATLAMSQILTIDNRHIAPRFAPGVQFVINVPQRMLFMLTDDGVRGYPVAVGRKDWQTPVGDFTIVSKETNPTWDVPESIREEARRAGRSLPLKVPPGPNNPLGAYWLGLSVGGIGIHGTNEPRTIYRAVTHGCIRLHPDDVAALFADVQAGTRGESVYQSILMAVDGEEVFLEAHPDIYERASDSVGFVNGLARELGVFDRVDWNLALGVLRERAGVARRVTRR